MSQLLKMRLVICSPFLVAVLYIGGCSLALAQVAASISGRVEDASGAAIAGVNVTAKSLETGLRARSRQMKRANYRILALPVGQYEVKAEKTGFRAAVQTGINLAVDQQAVVNLRLDVGQFRNE